jgi:hypothetical protein
MSANGCQLRLFSMLVHHGNNRHTGLGFVASGASVDPTSSAGIGACRLGEPSAQQIADAVVRGAVLVPLP